MFFEKLTETDMSLEQRINYQLNKFPAIKKVIKRCYQRTMYSLSPKIKCEGNITRISPDDPYHEYFFGYYDKSPWDDSGRYVLCLRAKDTWTDVAPDEPADICLIDTEHDNELEIIVELISKILSKTYKVVAITEDEWKEQRPYYLNLKKSQGKIDLIEEVVEEKVIQNQNNELDAIDNILNMIGSDLIEMEE